MLIFGYGSLVNVEHLQTYLGRSLVPGQDFIFCGLRNFRRCWTAAMDNRLNTPGYKYYVEKPTHSGRENHQAQENPSQNKDYRPNGFVTFLNIRPCSKTTITGIVFEVSNQELKHLDQRERNYRKLDITDMMDTSLSEQVYAYMGLEESEQRYQQGLLTKSAMISKDYYDLVYNAYESLGPQALADYLKTTDTPAIPIVELEKRQVPEHPAMGHNHIH